jgi:hypothetical protein
MRKLVVVLCVACALSSVAAAAALPRAASAKVRSCGTIKVPVNDIQTNILVSHKVLILSGNVSCKKATSVVRAIAMHPAFVSVEGYACKLGREDIGHTCTKGAVRIEDDEA